MIAFCNIEHMSNRFQSFVNHFNFLQVLKLAKQLTSVPPPVMPKRLTLMIVLDVQQRSAKSIGRIMKIMEIHLLQLKPMVRYLQLDLITTTVGEWRWSSNAVLAIKGSSHFEIKLFRRSSLYSSFYFHNSLFHLFSEILMQKSHAFSNKFAFHGSKQCQFGGG